ncbi:hypothetical protein cypCar_00047717 [Cyprinus carpio]|nr:hypothetical protein cypCar_00047717 [Cyprinus carpio]
MEDKSLWMFASSTRNSEASRNTCGVKYLFNPMSGFNGCLIGTGWGRTLWKRTLEAEFDLVECGRNRARHRGTVLGCSRMTILTAVDKKTVLVLSGSSGVVLWEMNLLFWTPSPRPGSVLTLNTYSVFMLWGQSPSHDNQTNENEMHSSFLLHPRYSQLLLERRNPAQNIMSFKATLLERGRHAGYLVLSGPDGRQHAGLGETEPVILTKRKIKGDVPESTVLRVGAESAVEEAEVKEAFYRLRFSDKLY